MKTLQGELLTCTPTTSDGLSEEEHGSAIINIVKNFRTLNNPTSSLLEEDKDRLANVILTHCNNFEQKMKDLVEAGWLVEVPQKKREAFGVACLIKAHTLLRVSDEIELEKAVATLDLALLIGMPLADWNVSHAVNVLLKQLEDRHTYDRDKRMLVENEFDSASDSDDDDEWEGEGPLDHFYLKMDELPKDDIISEDCPCVEFFMREYMRKNEPVKLLSCMTQWAAVVKWKYLAYLKRLVGVRVVPVEKGDYSRGGRVRLVTMNQYLDELFERRTAKDCGYLAQHDLLGQEPRLKKDVVVPDYCALGNQEEVTSYVWLGPARTLTPLHTDPHPNILAQVVGRKMVTLFSPADTPYLYPRTDGLKNNSQVDIKNPDLKKFPEFSNAVPLLCTLSPGDMLFIPAGWWHAVESLDISFSVNFFF